MFATPDIAREDRPDGSVVLRSREPLGSYPSSVVAMLRQHADASPLRTLIAQRDETRHWQRVSYGEVRARADAIGQALLDRGLGPQRPLLILSGNSIAHFLLTMGAMTVGAPVAPVSVAYSLQSKGHERITAIAGLLRPGMVFAEDGYVFSAALACVDAAVVVGRGQDAAPGAEPLRALLDTTAGADVEDAYQRIGPDTVAKVLFTSGSTGTPKGVLNTHRMLCSNQQAIRQVWPFLADEPPVLCDWLPWSHTFGGNHNMNLVLHNGGTLHIDEGKPSPELFGRTLANLAEVAPTISFNVPAGYAQLVPALEDDRALAESFFSRLRLIFNAAAALPASLRARLAALASGVTGREIPVTGAWGATETAPAVTAAHFAYTEARCIGVPLPGLDVKLAPVGEATEIRVRGDAVTPGYLDRPEETARAFDEDGFYRSGDAVGMIDPGDAGQGLYFQGRIAEDFKLDTGTFVRVGAVRTALLSAVPLLSDAVIAGENRSYVAALAWLNPAEAGELSLDPVDGCLPHPELRGQLGKLLGEFNAAHGSAGRVERLLVLADPPDLDAGEVTDKGYLNQRRVLDTRAAFVARLYADDPDPAVITADVRQGESWS